MSTNWDVIKQVSIAAATPGSLGGGSAFTVGSTQINGEILSVSFKTNIAPGSIFLVQSGPEGQQLLWGTKAGSSNLFATQYPRVYPVDNTNTAISGAGGNVVTRAVNGIVILGGSAPDGGSIDAFIVRYR